AEQREDHGQGHGSKEFSFHAFEREDGQVHDHDDQLAEHGRLANFHGGVADDVDTIARLGFVAPEPAHDVFDHDPRAIDDETKIEGAQAQQAGGDAEAQHAAEGAQERQWDRQGDHQAGAQVAQEDEQDGDDEQAPLEQVFAHGIQHLVHEPGALIHRGDPDVGGQVLFD